MGIFKDLSGLKFGRLTVIKHSHKNKHGQWFWECKCQCGNKKKISGYNLKNGGTKSCGCSRIHDITGMKFNMLTAIKRVGKNENGGWNWEFKCDCGGKTITKGDRVKSGSTMSCGCLKWKHIIKPGDKFGNLTVLKKSHKNRCNTWVWECKCKCGNTTQRWASSLKSGGSKSCGCTGQMIAWDRYLEN